MSLIDRAISTGIRRGWDRGIGKGQRVWLVVGGVALLARVARSALHREPEVVLSKEIRPGESVTVTHEARD
ncbi:MAG TPA: hypothetical protein VMO88_08685 [Acidimicrobiales bacterium]|nr:hypothetical protein [Acidimicrobiales bacterium]